ncbi:class I SAM-dependent methyltransferase, partial [Streptomyces rubiginosohelvolus]|uniref:class I SAM-dependent methyltransferase n=1 Tax=Streptomyces rubiginosohelvolus TaxID=67362 RepID=UPI0033D9300F
WFGLTFVHGGFEIPLPVRPTLIRAANVLRQYDEDQVAEVWARLCSRLAPGGLLVEGTCDEIGRRHVWVALGPEGPRTVTFATRLGSLERPSDLAERLPKALIHRNVPGEPVHAFLRDFDRAWAAASPYASLGARQRWIAAVRTLAADWPVVDGVRRWRQGEVTVGWDALRPDDHPSG